MLCQGGVSVLQRKKLCNLDRTPDTGHGVWNDAKGAFKKAKEYKHVTLMCATWGVIHGPFGSDSRFQEVRAVVDHFCKTCTDPRKSPYFMASVPRMALDEDDPSIFCVPDLAEEMLRRFKADNPFKIKGSCKMSFNRFMSACKKGRDEMPQWSKACFGIGLACLRQDYFSGAKFKKIAIGADDPSNTTTSSSRQSAAELCAIVRARACACFRGSF